MDILNRLTISLLALTILLSCQREESVTRQLTRAEQLMPNRPDSAMALLDFVKPLAVRSTFNKATWCLLITEAEERCDVIHGSDSTINIAVNYFKQYAKSERYMSALFYKGCVMEDLSMNDSALFYFKKALDVAFVRPRSENLFLIYSRMGDLSASMHQQEEAVSSYQNACNYAVQADDSSSLAKAYIGIGKVYVSSREWEQAENSFRQALRIAGDIHDRQTLQKALCESAGLYISVGRYRDATSCMQDLECMCNTPDSFDYARACLVIGNRYRTVHQNDSAIAYLNRAAQTSDVGIRRQAFHDLLYVFRERYGSKGELSRSYEEPYYVDSVMRAGTEKNIAEINRKYRSEKLMNEMILLRLRNTTMATIVVCSVLLSVVLIIVVVYISKRRLMRKNRTIYTIREQLAELRLRVDFNEQTIQNNKSIIRQQATMLQQQGDVQEMSPQVNLLEQANRDLEDTNRRLKEKIRERTLMLSIKEEKLTAVQQLADERKMYPNILIRLRQDGKHISSDEEWEELTEMTDRMYNDFTRRLSAAYPSLKRNDINFCCLMRQGYNASKMAELLSITDESLTKRKQRLKKRIDRERRWEIGEIETFISSF